MVVTTCSDFSVRVWVPYAVNENQTARAMIHELYSQKGSFRTKVVQGKEEEGRKYEDYFDCQEPVTTAPSHRILVMRRGAKEGFLRLQVIAPEEQALQILEGLFVKGRSASSTLVKEAVLDSYKRLLLPSMGTEILAATKQRADQEAIRVFAENLRQLLLAPPLGQKSVLAVDPGFRTGCKVVCLDRQGRLKHSDVIYPHQSEKLAAADASKTTSLCKQFNIEVIAIGNGTASRETETFIRNIRFSKDIPVIIVNESGASVYSASEIAREEFPNEDATVRGAVSIGRRLKAHGSSCRTGKDRSEVDRSRSVPA